MPKYATIDIGSNSILMLVSDSNGLGHFATVADKMEIPRLGEGIQATGMLKSEAMNRAIEVLSRFVEVAKNYPVDAIAAVGTMCLRQARNSQVFLQRTKSECGLTVEVISGEEEARLAFLAVKHGLNLGDQPFIVYDIGGGSTELVFGERARIVRRFSLNLGAVTLTEKYFTSAPVPVPKEQLAELLTAIKANLDNLPSGDEGTALVGVGGTITTMAAVMLGLAKYESVVVHGAVLPFSEVERQMELYRAKTIEERRSIPGLQPERADIILAGVGIVYCLMKKFGADSAMVSDHGIRHGLMLDRFGVNTAKAI